MGVVAEPTAPLVHVKDVVKRFPGVVALADARLDLYAGEVHALIGENGAGKSSLIKVLSGYYTPDSGVVEIGGEPLHHSVASARSSGVATIHQERHLIPDLTIAENVVLPDWTPRGVWVRPSEIQRRAAAVLETLVSGVDLRQPARAVSPAVGQMVEIARGLAQDARILIFDEPTTALSLSERERLFETIDRLAGSVTFDNVGGGAEAADFIAGALNGQGKVLELTGPQGAFHAELRHQGFIDQIGTVPGIKVETRDAHFSADEALTITVDVLTDDPDYQAIFVHTDGMLRGVLSALEQLGLTPGEDIIVVGLDGTPEALDLIRDGSVAATVSADPIAMGCEAAKMMATVLEGGKGSDVLVPPTLVTSENVDDAELWGNKPLG